MPRYLTQSANVFADEYSRDVVCGRRRRLFLRKVVMQHFGPADHRFHGCDQLHNVQKDHRCHYNVMQEDYTLTSLRRDGRYRQSALSIDIYHMSDKRTLVN